MLPAVAYLGSRNGTVSVAQLAGAAGGRVTPLTSILVFSSPTSWHGLTSVHAAGTRASYFLYATYTAPADPNCVDDGTNAGNASLRPPLTVVGCPRAGALARWPLTADGLGAGPLELLFSGGCSQFGASERPPPPPPPLPRPPPHTNCLHPIAPADGVDFVTSDATGSLYVSIGAGANDGRNSGADAGQLGPQPAPCTAPGSAWGGHFNALAPGSSAGKVLRFAPPPATAVSGLLPAPTIIAAGLHNPFRGTWARVPARRGAPAPAAPALFVLDSAGAGAVGDEINGPLRGGESFGWPCELGAGEVVAQFAALPGSPCGLTGPHTPAFFTSRATAALSALEFHPPSARWVAADASSGLLFSFSPLDSAGWSQAAADASTTIEEPKAANPYSPGVARVTQLLWVPAAQLVGVVGLAADAGGALLAVDYGRGLLRQIVPVNGSTGGTSGAAAAAAGAIATLLAAALPLLLLAP